ncbi:hypothetical protein [Cohnella lupini]|uniref:Uncharacterized protein n=1 Tax=Cohnella lupini TaxID=1294267 RepID=A0A3D9IQF6_9BACL|nr:hypothetical protein [Cohnella lupini]RED64013.1 hypothetical protein DFP95_103254 [Cohnella lupini]
MNEQPENNEHFENQKSFSPILQPDNGPLRHSGLGIASFVLAIVSIFAFVGVTIGVIVLISNEIDFSTLVDSNNELTMSEEELVEKLKPLLGYLIAYPLILIVNVIGLIFGIVGLVRVGYKKVFSVIGTVMNGLAIFAVIMLMLIAFLQNGIA